MTVRSRRSRDDVGQGRDLPAEAAAQLVCAPCSSMSVGASAGPKTCKPMAGSVTVVTCLGCRLGPTTGYPRSAACGSQEIRAKAPSGMDESDDLGDHGGVGDIPQAPLIQVGGVELSVRESPEGEGQISLALRNRDALRNRQEPVRLDPVGAQDEVRPPVGAQCDPMVADLWKRIAVG